MQTIKVGDQLSTCADLFMKNVFSWERAKDRNMSNMPIHKSNSHGTL